jgi:hypothetical protein
MAIESYLEKVKSDLWGQLLIFHCTNELGLLLVHIWFKSHILIVLDLIHELIHVEFKVLPIELTKSLWHWS